MDSDTLNWDILCKILIDYDCPLEASAICAESIISYSCFCNYEVIEEVISKESDKGNYSIYMDSLHGDFRCYFDKEYYNLFKQGKTGA